MEIKPITRDSNGLISGINYVQGEDGLIDWRKMVEPAFLVPNKRVFERAGLAVPESTEGLEDNKLLILLGGIKKLARLRGYTSLDYRATSPAPGYVISVCTIEWIPNFETEGRVVSSSGIADAHSGNTDSLGGNFLAATAENRSFVRCVRNFLGINIVGQDETCSKLSETDSCSSTVPTSPEGLLEKLMIEKNVTFEDIKQKLIREKVEGAENFNSVSDMPRTKIFEFMARLQKKRA